MATDGSAPWPNPPRYAALPPETHSELHQPSLGLSTQLWVVQPLSLIHSATCSTDLEDHSQATLLFTLQATMDGNCNPPLILGISTRLQSGSVPSFECGITETILLCETLKTHIISHLGKITQQLSLETPENRTHGVQDIFALVPPP